MNNTSNTPNPSVGCLLLLFSFTILGVTLHAVFNHIQLEWWKWAIIAFSSLVVAVGMARFINATISQLNGYTRTLEERELSLIKGSSQSINFVFRTRCPQCGDSL